MSFLSPTAIALAAGLTIPPLVALYFLKLKRTVQTVPSTMLWKRSVEDLQVNAPFQRLRGSLLLLLQLLVLIAGAIALGQPMFQTAERHEDNIIILIDQSASMAVLESSGRTRLETAQEQAKLCVDNMGEGARAMVIAYCDRATVVSSFDTSRDALKRKIDSIEQTQSTSALSEAVSLAEAYAQNITIGTEEAGSDIAPESAAAPATLFLFTDGRIEDAGRVTLKRFDPERIRLTVVGERGDNIGIVAMDARRSYEHPEVLEVAATVRNFGSEAIGFDAVLNIEGRPVDVQSVSLAPATSTEGPGGGSEDPAAGAARVIAFDPVEFEGGGVVEVVLRVDDALAADNRAWTIIDPPRHLRVLLVTEGNLFLENVLATLPVELTKMDGVGYESAEDRVIRDGPRSAFDVVILDGHSTGRLPQGNYMFWHAAPKIEGVTIGRVIDDQVIFNWDDTHPILRHLAIETLFVYQWLELTVPPEAESLIEGETSPVLAYLTRDASQYLICAFGLTTRDADGNVLMNTHWVTSPDFVVFMQNAVQYLGGTVAAASRRSILPGQPVTLPVPESATTARIHRPDNDVDEVGAGAHHTVHYARTRRVGTYRLEPGAPGRELFAVNLFSPVESLVAPVSSLTLGAGAVATTAGEVEINQPAWKYLLAAMLVLLLFEWIVYNRRVLV